MTIDFKTQYQNYMKSKQWEETRWKALEYHGHYCHECGATKDSGLLIHVHHKHYNTLGNEDIVNDVVPLCSSCHAKAHKLLRIVKSVKFAFRYKNKNNNLIASS